MTTNNTTRVSSPRVSVAGICTLLALSVVACGGEMGPPGIQGEQGVAGPQGPAGPSGQNGSGLASITDCTAPFQAVGDYSFAVYYSRYDFADGSVMTTCEIADRNSSYTGLSMYKAGMNGANNGACVLNYDVDGSAPTGGYWSVLVARAATSGTATYQDSSSARNGKTLALTCQTF